MTPAAGPHPERPAESSAAPASLGQEAVVGPALVAAEHLDQLAQLVPDVDAPPVPTATDLAALPAAGGDVLAPIGPSTDAPAMNPVPLDIAPATGHPSDALADTFGGHVFVTATPLDLGAHPSWSAGPASNFSDPILSPSVFHASAASPPLPFHAVPQDHNLLAALPATRASAADLHPPADLHPAVVPAHPATAATVQGAATHAAAPISGAGADTLITGAVGVGVVFATHLGFEGGVTGHTHIVASSPTHTLSIQPIDGGYTITEDGRSFALNSGKTLATGSDNDQVTVAVGAHGSVSITAHSLLAISGTVNGDLSITSGAITGNGPLVVNGNMTVTALSSTYLFAASSGVASVSSFDIGGHLTFSNGGAITGGSASASIGGSFFKNPISSIDGHLTITSDGAVQPGGSYTLAGLGYSAAEAHPINLALDPIRSHA